MTATQELLPDPATEGQWQPRGRPVRLAVLILVVSLAGSFAAVHTGVVAADVSAQASNWTEATPGGDGTVVLGLVVQSHRAATVTIERVGESLPGLRLVSVQRPDPFLPDMAAFEPSSLDSGGTGLELQLTYEVTDCAAIPRDHRGVPFVARSAFGRTTTTRERLVLSAVASAPDSYTYEGDVDPFDEPWQVTLTRSACRS